MMLTLNKIKKLLNKYDVNYLKSFGQNFLICQHVVEKIISSKITKNKEIVEIGPGLGSLTNELLKKSKKVLAYEVDHKMIEILNKTIFDKKLKIINGDFTQQSFPWNSKKIIIANIPYNITTKILFHIFKNKNKFESATLMVQKEYAEKMLAKTNSKKYGKLALTIRLLTISAKKIVDVNPSCFYPKPKVHSSVIQLNFNAIKYDEKIINFIKEIFRMRRKTLMNNLKRNGYEISVIKAALLKLKLDEKIRPQNLEIEIVLKLYKELNK